MLQCSLNFHPNLSSPPGSCGLDFWQSTPALEWMKKYLHAEPVQIQVSEGGKHASLLCMLRRLPCGLFLASAYPYGFIAGDTDLFWKAKKQIVQTLFKRRIVRLEIAFSGEFIKQLNNIPHHSGILFPPKLEALRHVLDLAPAATNPDWLEKNFGSKIRWAMRKAERSGATVRPAHSNESGTIQQIYRQTMRAKGAPVNYGEERFKGIINDLSPLGLGEIYIGHINGEPAGFAAIVKGHQSWHLVQVAVPPENQSYRLSELLIGTAIREAASKKITYFDFMASQKSDKGLIAFKAKWKGIPEPINHAVIPTFPLLHHAVTIGRYLNRIKGRMNGN